MTDTVRNAMLNLASVCGHPNGSIQPKKIWSLDMIDAGIALAIACGVPAAKAETLGQGAYLALYSTARSAKGSPAAIRLAQRQYGAGQGETPPAPADSPQQPPQRPQQPMDWDKLQAMVDTSAANLKAELPELIRKHSATTVTIERKEAPKVDVGLTHKLTPKILSALSTGVNLYCWGEAGAGKSYMAEIIAKAFGKKLYVSGKLADEFGILGHIQPHDGSIFKTPFRLAYEAGELFFFDEVDRSHDSALVALNMALANGHCPFPDGLVKKGAGFMCFASGNTPMLGGDDNFTSAQQQDGAFRDRFQFMEMNIDETLETAIAPNKDWCNRVQQVRAAIKAYGEATVNCTPRATIEGAKLLATGDFTRDEVEEMSIWKGLHPDTVRAIKLKLPRYTQQFATAA